MLHECMSAFKLSFEDHKKEYRGKCDLQPCMQLLDEWFLRRRVFLSVGPQGGVGA